MNILVAETGGFGNTHGNVLSKVDAFEQRLERDFEPFGFGRHRDPVSRKIPREKLSIAVMGPERKQCVTEWRGPVPGASDPPWQFAKLRSSPLRPSAGRSERRYSSGPCAARRRRGAKPHARGRRPVSTGERFNSRSF